MTNPKSYYDMTTAERSRVDQARADQHRYNVARFEANGRKHDERRARQATSRSIVAATLCAMVLHTYPPVDPKAVRQAMGAAVKPDAGPHLMTPGEARRAATVEGWTS